MVARRYRLRIAGEARDVEATPAKFIRARHDPDGNGSHRHTMLRFCDDFVRVSAGLHVLLWPLKQQLDRVQALYWSEGRRAGKRDGRFAPARSSRLEALMEVLPLLVRHRWRIHWPDSFITSSRKPASNLLHRIQYRRHRSFAWPSYRPACWYRVWALVLPHSAGASSASH